MTARQQIVRVAPLVLLFVLVITGLRGTVPSPRWNGPLRGDGVAVGLALEAVRRPAEPLVIEDVPAQELREAVARGQAALAAVDDARAAIIACYAAMEQRLADRGTARGAADTPDELLARAVAAGTVRGTVRQPGG